MKTQMDQQTELLKLIVKKMEIKTEDGDNDSDAVQVSFENIKSKKDSAWSGNIANSRLRSLVLQRLMTRKDSFEEELN